MGRVDRYDDGSMPSKRSSKVDEGEEKNVKGYVRARSF